jgi:uncharacterized protein with GYD domain
MQTYVVLINFTQQGVANIKEGPARLDAAREAYKAIGGELQAFYLTMGRFDAISIGTVPDDKAGARMALAIGAQGNIRTESLRAFPEDEYREIVAGLP